ncbi:MAG: radical SAM protein [Bacteroidales bacterium]|nr:radical SAM protein [Bacteroidales bacterium]
MPASLMDIVSIAHLTPCTEAEGPGKRFAVWFQGCPLRCPGCCNPEFLPFRGGTPTRLKDLIAQLQQAQQELGITGITLLGGEPFAHAAGAAGLAEAAQERGLTVMVFTGYLLEDLRARSESAIAELLAQTDLLVDGPYDRTQPDTRRRWIGSQNQRIHFLTERYRADDPCWQQRNTLEIRVSHDGISVNGFPAHGAVGLWKGWQRPTRTSTRTESETETDS